MVEFTGTLLYVVIALGAGLLLIIAASICVCCCCNSDNHGVNKRSVAKQKRKYAPRSDNEKCFVLCIGVSLWKQLVATDKIHACGADLRMRSLISEVANSVGAYYVHEGDNSARDTNVKVIVGNSANALISCCDQILSKAIAMDFSNNMQANDVLREVYPHPAASGATTKAVQWYGLHLQAAMHAADQCAITVPNPEDEDNIVVGGEVVSDCVSMCNTLATDDGVAICSSSFHSLIKRTMHLQIEPMDECSAISQALRKFGAFSKIQILNSDPFRQFESHAIVRMTSPSPGGVSGASNGATPQPVDDETDILKKIQKKREGGTSPAVTALANKPGQDQVIGYHNDDEVEDLES